VSSAENFLASLIDFERNTKVNYEFKLDRFRSFLHSIKDPQDKLNNVIIIAGTKGKGSTAAFIDSALRACQLKTGLYTSPHIFSARERIKFNGGKISQNDLSRLVNKIKSQARKFDITYFEAMTAIAFLFFLEKKPDYTILEVGLGGRLDATNVVKPIVSVITRIGYDHTNILGKTLTKIAREKTGIIKSKAFVVISAQRPSALKIIKQKIRKTKNRYCETEKEFEVSSIVNNIKGSRFTIRNKGDFETKMLGNHQIENALNAIAVLSYLKEKDLRITDTGVKLGIKTAQIPARCQIISKNPLIIVDGAHNPESAQALYKVINDIIKRKAIVVFGASQGKSVKEMFRILVPITEKIILTQSINPRHIAASQLAEILAQYKIPFITTNSVKMAIKQGLKLANKKTPLVITGSFYVASEALKILKPV